MDANEVNKIVDKIAEKIGVCYNCKNAEEIAEADDPRRFLLPYKWLRLDMQAASKKDETVMAQKQGVFFFCSRKCFIEAVNKGLGGLNG